MEKNTTPLRPTVSPNALWFWGVGLIASEAALNLTGVWSIAWKSSKHQPGEALSLTVIPRQFRQTTIHPTCSILRSSVSKEFLTLSILKKWTEPLSPWAGNFPIAFLRFSLNGGLRSWDTHGRALIKRRTGRNFRRCLINWKSSSPGGLRQGLWKLSHSLSAKSGFPS